MALATLIASCGFQNYQPKPIYPEKSLTKITSRDPNSEEFQRYLYDLNYPKNNIPIKKWGLRELTLCAFFFSPELDLARSKWNFAKSEIAISGQRPTPGMSTIVEHHSKAEGGISPWTFGLSLEIPVETSGKRSARMEQAYYLSEVERIQIAQEAWNIRHKLQLAWIEYNHSLQEASILQEEVQTRNEIVLVLQKRFNSGFSSSIELNNSLLDLQRTRQNFNQISLHTLELKDELASLAGLTPSTFNQLLLDIPGNEEDTTGVKEADDERLTNIINNDSQRYALQNRLDIHAALARYSAAEAKLKIEIAKQYPDITLIPSYIYDQEDNIWSLGLSGILTLIHKNKNLIEQAKILRDMEASEFELLQSNIIAELTQNKARYFASQSELNQEAHQIELLNTKVKQTENQYKQGIADQLDLFSSKLERLIAEENLRSID